MPQSSPKYTSEAILRKIDELGKDQPWFHCIDLGQGTKTMQASVPHLEALWSDILKCLPNDLSGKSVLDIGCNAGFYSVQAKKMGAEYVLGIDLSDNYLMQAEFVKDVLDLDIDYQKMSIFEVSQLKRTFDIVFCLGVIYHCADPLSVAKCVESMTDSIAIVESAVVKYEGVSDKPLWQLVFPGHVSQSLLMHESESSYNWWFPNVQGMTSMFQSVGFKKIEIIHEIEDRAAILCYK